MKLRRAQKFLENVKLQKEAVPFRNRNGGAGRHAQVCLFERELEASDLTVVPSGQGLAHGAGGLAQEGGRVFAGTVAERAVQR
jgi:ribosomal protein L22